MVEMSANPVLIGIHKHRHWITNVREVCKAMTPVQTSQTFQTRRLSLKDLTRPIHADISTIATIVLSRTVIQRLTIRSGRGTMLNTELFKSQGLLVKVVDSGLWQWKR